MTLSPVRSPGLLSPQSSSAVLNERSEMLDRRLFSYKLLGESGQYGMDTILPEQMDMDPSRMSVWIPYADGNRRDGVGDRIEVGGIRTERHRTNPILLFDHGKSYVLPIALAEDRDTKEYCNEIDVVNQTARINAFFYQGKGLAGMDRGQEFDHAVFCEQLYHLLCKRLLRSGSIGYQVIKATEIPPDYETGAPKGLHLLVTLLLEVSVVVLPANPDTVRKVLAMPSVCGKSLSPILAKSLSCCAPEKKAQLGYEVKSGDTETNLKKTVASFSDIEGIGPDYQKLFWNPATKEVWWESFDGDEPDAIKEIVRRLKAVLGVKKVTVESESSPKGEDWIRIGSDGRKGKSLKEIRQRRRKAMDKPVRADRMLNSSTIQERGVAAGDTLIARTYLNDFPPGSMKPIPFARTGDRLTVVQIVDSGLALILRNADGMESRQSVQKVRLKDLGGNAQAKSLPNIRQKYRQAKYFRRRQRKSAPGMSTVYVRSKDLPSVQQAAEQKGVRFERTGVVGGMEKVRLSGDDSAIDGIAQQYGQSVARTGSKPLTEHKGKSMSKKLPKRTKDLPADGGESAAEPVKAQAGEEEAPEVYGAQVLRRIHSDHSILMEEYDEMMGVLENDRVKGHLQKQLERLEAALTETESLFEKEYQDLPKLEGAEEKDLGEEAEEADSGEEEEPTGDEAVQGMMHKGLDYQRIAVARKRYGKKALCPKCGANGCKCGKSLGGEGGTGTQERLGGRGWVVYWVCNRCGAATSDESAARIHEARKPGHIMEKKTHERKALDADGQMDEADDIAEVPAAKSLEPHQRKAVGEASSFLHELSGTDSFGDEHRMKAYHHSKSLDFGMGGAMGAATDIYGADDGEKKALDAEGQMDKADDLEEIQVADKDLANYKSISDASQFLGELSTTQDFSDECRQKCLLHHKALNPIAEEVAEDLQGGDQDKPDGSMGEMGEKKILALKKTFAKQNEEIGKLTKKLAGLTATV